MTSRGAAEPPPTGRSGLAPGATVPDGPVDTVARYAAAYGALTVSVEIAVERWHLAAARSDGERLALAGSELDRLATTLDRVRRRVGT